MLKTLKLPSVEEFEVSLDEAQKWESFEAACTKNYKEKVDRI